MSYETYIDEEGHEVHVWNTGTKLWHKNGKLHRDGDKPAIVFRDGEKRWFKNGKFHRDGDKPAIVCKNGVKTWYKNGKPHRENNPAGINNFYDYYLLNDERMNPVNYWIRLLLMEY